MKMSTNTTKQRIVRNVLIVLTVAALLVAGYSVYAYSTSNWPFQEAGSNSETSAGDTETRETNDVDYSEPTEGEVTEGQAAKKRDLEATKEAAENQANDSDSSTKRTVAVGVPYAGVYDGALEVRAFTNGAIESGTCTVTATKAGVNTRVTETLDAFIDASTTQCEPIRIPTSRLSAGTWNVVVEFSSATHEGKSDNIEVQIP